MKQLELTHYGIEVDFFTGEYGAFLHDLNTKGIAFTDLPFSEPHVIKYSTDGISRYAIIVPSEGIEECRERVYITPSIPDDCNWFKLISDIDNQLRFANSEPAKLPSRISVLLDHAFKKVRDVLADEYTVPNQNVIFDDDEELIVNIPDNILLREVSSYLRCHFGITKDELISNIGVHDVSEKRIMELADAWTI